MILTFELNSGKVVGYDAHGFYPHDTEANTYMIVVDSGLHKLSDVKTFTAKVK